MQSKAESSPVLDFTTIARNIYSNEHRDSVMSSHSCEVSQSDSDMMTLPDQQDHETMIGADVKERFQKVQNAANSAARIK